MTPVIFIRTYEKDFEWLTYCLRSLAVHAPHIPTVVTAPNFSGFEAPVRDNLHFRFCATRHADGYVDQQLCKLWADNVATVVPDATHVIHLDSDTALVDSLDHVFSEGKPIMLRTPYDDLPREAEIWRAPTEKHLGFPVAHEYMRRLPLVYPISLYAKLRIHLAARHGHEWQRWVDTIEGRQVSEFNLLGAFAYKYHRNQFKWVDTDSQPLPPLVVKQHWSWGGIAEHKADLERLFPAA